MKKTILLFCVALLFASACFAQTVTLTFTGRDGGNHHIELEYLTVTNVTKGWQEYLFWPDTVLTIQPETGIQNVETMPELSLRTSSHSPNPFSGTTDVTLTVAEEGMVNLEIADMNGRVVWADDYTSLPGVHQFRVTLAHAGIYVMSARHNGKTSSIKMVCNNGGNANKVEYVGVSEMDSRETKTAKSHTRGLVTRPFDFGDQMRYVGYAIINYEEAESQCIEQPLTESQTFVLPFSATQLALPVVITANVTNITDNSAVCGGQVTNDGGDSMTVRGVCINLLPNPTIANRHTVDGNGVGSFTSQLTGLSSNITYYVRAYATNDLGTAYGEEETFTIPINTEGDAWSCPGIPSLMDIDGNRYNTVQIGQQCWMRENLRTKKYADGTPILQGTGSSTTIGYWYYPMNQAEYMSTYGLLYNWKATMHGATSSNSNPSGVQGVCPDGWHVPSDAECTQLLNYVRGQSQNWCGGDSLQFGKSLAATVGWDYYVSDSCTVGNTNLSTNNATGFGALPAGFYNPSAAYTVGSSYGGLGYVTFYWSSTGTYSSYGYYDIYYLGLHSNDVSVIHHDVMDTDGEAHSVRCVKD
jgi:uncharacterized protein (TIGR02145 family)